MLLRSLLLGLFSQVLDLRSRMLQQKSLFNLYSLGETSLDLFFCLSGLLDRAETFKAENESHAH